MALKYRDVSPTEIIYRGTSITELKFGSTGVWGKPYSVSTDIGEGITLTIERTSSPNQNATLGTISDGSVIYHGDVLNVSYTIGSNYQVVRAILNGQTMTGLSQQVVVESNLTITITTEEKRSWNTAWTGDVELTTTINKYCTINALPTEYRVSIRTTNNYSNDVQYQTLNFTTSERKTITGYWHNWDNDEMVQENIGSIDFIAEFVSGGSFNINIGLVNWAIGTTSGEDYTVVLTKIEAYY